MMGNPLMNDASLSDNPAVIVEPTQIVLSSKGYGCY